MIRSVVTAGLLSIEQKLFQLRKRLNSDPVVRALTVQVYPEKIPGSVYAARTVDVLQSELARLPQTVTPLRHTFVPGLYAREIFVPAGTIVITKIHKTEHVYVVSKGSLAVWVDGVGVKRISAPFTGVTKPGTRRVCYTYTDVVWTTFHPTEETDLEKIEEDVIFKRDLELPAGEDPRGIVRELLLAALPPQLSS